MTDAPVFDVIVAMDADRGIGRDNDLPWHLPGDLAHFKRTTTHTEQPGKRNAVIMGRKTWESIPPRYRPLKGRFNVVLTRQTDLVLPEGVGLAGNFDEALRVAAAPDVETIFVVGGGAVYAEALNRPECRWLYLTRVRKSFECDTVFPTFASDYERREVLSSGRDGDIDYDIELWQRRI